MESSDKPQIPSMREGDPACWLTPGKTPHANSVLRGPSADVSDLDVELCKDPEWGTIVSVSAWELDDHQRELIAAGAHLRMSVWQHPIPPLALAIEVPFCGACKAPKVYVKSERQFFCAGACPERDPRFGPSPLQPITEESTNGSQPEDDRDASRRALDQAHGDFEAVQADGEDDDPPPAA